MTSPGSYSYGMLESEIKPNFTTACRNVSSVLIFFAIKHKNKKYIH